MIEAFPDYLHIFFMGVCLFVLRFYGPVNPIGSCQPGGNTLWKTGEMVKKKSLQGKIREFEILLKIREKSGNLKKSYLCKVKIFKFYSCSDVATGGFFLPYA